MKEVDIGNESFADMINNDSYYVDKTSFIKSVFKKGVGRVMLITRPRRFGKTLTMNTFLYGNNAVVKYFLNKIRNFFSKVLFGTKPYNSMSCVKSTAFFRDKKIYTSIKTRFGLFCF